MYIVVKENNVCKRYGDVEKCNFILVIILDFNLKYFVKFIFEI